MSKSYSEYCKPECAEILKLHEDGVITWYPWVGVDYKEGGLMVVGESNYADGDMGDSPEKACKAVNDNVNFTKEMVMRFSIKRNDTNKTFTGISKVLCYDSLLTSDIVDIGCSVWRRIAYMDVIQKAMQGLPNRKKKLIPNAWENRKHRERPSKELWEPGWLAVLNVIEILKPDAILFVGCGVADHCNHKFLPQGYNGVMRKERIGRERAIWREGVLSLSSGKAIRFGAMPNPGKPYGFNYTDWRDRVQRCCVEQ